MKHLAIAAFTLFSLTALAQEWSYSAPNGPAQWGRIGFDLCAAGADQSPIAIESGRIAGLSNVTPDGSLTPLSPAWLESTAQVVNNGHTIQVVVPAGSRVEFEGTSFDLKQFHFHSPSEHMLDERQYPLEAHFVHQSASGLLVVGVFFTEGEENATLRKIWGSAPASVSTVSLPDTLNALALLPTSPEFFTYSGSLTTPPCTENVRWIVMRRPLEASAEQLRFLQKLLGFSNNRPTQPLDGRLINVGNGSQR